jgi:lysophospholipase L1-like esterase
MKTTRIAALGDSITKGVVLNDQNRYSAAEQSFLDILSSELDLRVDNYGKFGCTVSHGNSVIERHTADIADSDYTFIEYGGNDCDFDWMKIAQDPRGEHKARTPLEEFTEELSSLVAKIKELGSVPILITLPPILSDTYFSFLSRSMSDEQKTI